LRQEPSIYKDFWTVPATTCDKDATRIARKQGRGMATLKTGSGLPPREFLESIERLAESFYKPKLPEPPWSAIPIPETVWNSTAMAKPPNKGGAPSRWDWEGAAIAVFGRIYRAEVPEPSKIADVARLLAEWFVEQTGREPSETELKRHARRLLPEVGN
jgi:hypothetical protein